MRLSRIAIRNFLSFGEFVWEGLDPTLNLIVGPNDAGKSNLLRAVLVVRDALQRSGARREWEGSAYGSLPDAPFSISIDLELTSKWERGVLAAFVAAAFCDEQGQQSQALPFATPEARSSLSELLQQRHTAESVEWLFAGRITVDYRGAGLWRSRYEALPAAGDAGFVWELEGPRGVVLARRDQGQVASYNELAATWWDTLDEQERATYNAFFERHQETAPTPDLRRVLGAHSVALSLRVTRPTMSSLPTHRQFEYLSGTPLTNGRTVEAHQVLAQLVGAGVSVTDNVRLPAARRFSASDLHAAHVDLANGERIALYLFQQRNALRPAGRKAFRDAEQVFQSLTGQDFEVGLASPPEQAVLGQLDQQGEVQLEITVRDQWREVPLRRKGAGIAEALYLAALMTSPEEPVILLDEPAGMLHPPVQTLLSDELLARSDAQFFVATHSPKLVSPNQLVRVSRLSLVDGQTRRGALPADASHDYLARIEKVFRASTDARGLLFARAVLLVEGETELGAIPIWFQQSQGRGLDQLGITAYSVNGHHGFEAMVMLLESFAIPWAILCDGPAIASSSSWGVLEQLRRAGVSELPSLGQIPTAFEERRQMLEQQGVFSLASVSNDEFEDHPAVKQALPDAKRVVDGRSKARLGHHVAETVACPGNVASLLSRIANYLRSNAEPGRHSVDH